MDDLLFVMLRHVNSSMSDCDKVWQKSYKSIRKFYNNKIVIVDNNSDYNLINNNINLENCETFNNHYYDTRIFAPLLYLLYVDFNKAVVIHDGVIFQKYVDFSKFQNVKYIWHFDTKLYDNDFLISNQLNVLENNNVLLNMLRNKTYTGCMGCCFAIEKQFLQTLENKYKISNLKNVIDNQEKAIAFERTFSILCCSEFKNIIDDISYEGEIRDMVWGYIYQHYISGQKIFDLGNNKTIDITNKSIIKIFGARK